MDTKINLSLLVDKNMDIAEKDMVSKAELVG